MKTTLLAVLMLAGIGAQAQDALISGHLLTKKNATQPPHLVNEQRGVDMPVKLENDNTFKITVKKVTKGFYELGAAGIIYLEPGYKLKLEAQPDSSYTFTGKGSEENNILNKVKWQDSKWLPLSGDQIIFTWKVLSDPIDTFLTDIQQYKAATAKTMSASQNADFRKLAEAHTNYYALNLLPQFELKYGFDRDRYQNYIKVGRGDKTDPFYSKKVQQAGIKVFKKILRARERMHIDSLYYLSLNWDDETLLDNSPEYQKTLISATELIAGRKTVAKDEIKLGAINEAKTYIKSPKNRGFVVSHCAMDFMRLSNNSTRVDSVYQVAIAEQLSVADRKKIDDLHNGAGKTTK